MATVHNSIEHARGCGFRKGGGMYLVSGGLSEPCPKLPLELHICPTCGAGVKQTRGFTWIQPDPLLDPGPHAGRRHDDVCPLGTAVDWSEGRRAGLIWIGAQFYPRPEDFMAEAAAMGVSRRIAQVPRDLVVGETWIALAHPKAVPGECEHGAPAGAVCSRCPKGESAGEWRAGVVTFFRPTAIEYVVKGDESEDELDRLEERGFRLVRVVRAGEQVGLDELDEDAA
jgi:hypothetical protein